MHVWDAADYRANLSAQLGLARDFLSRVAIPPEGRVLDVGCGDGKVTALIEAAQVTGCDRSAEMVGFAYREHPRCTSSSPTSAICRSTPSSTWSCPSPLCRWVVNQRIDTLAGVQFAAGAEQADLWRDVPGDGNMAQLAATARQGVCKQPA